MTLADETWKRIKTKLKIFCFSRPSNQPRRGAAVPEGAVPREAGPAAVARRTSACSIRSSPTRSWARDSSESFTEASTEPAGTRWQSR